MTFEFIKDNFSKIFKPENGWIIEESNINILYYWKYSEDLKILVEYYSENEMYVSSTVDPNAVFSVDLGSFKTIEDAMIHIMEIVNLYHKDCQEKYPI